MLGHDGECRPYHHAQDDPQEKVFETDGRALPGNAVRVVDDRKRPVPPDTVGNLQARGITHFVGYLKKPELNSIDADGWFDTGDLARMGADGYIRIVGRTKDVIIRGGENIPVAEVENLIYRHPRVAECAVVAMPDARLGERGCAFVAPKGDTSLDLAELTRFLGEQGMSKSYWPERFELMPRCRAHPPAKSRNSSCGSLPPSSRPEWRAGPSLHRSERLTRHRRPEAGRLGLALRAEPALAARLLNASSVVVGRPRQHVDTLTASHQALDRTAVWCASLGLVPRSWPETLTGAPPHPRPTCRPWRRAPDVRGWSNSRTVRRPQTHGPAGPVRH